MGDVIDRFIADVKASRRGRLTQIARGSGVPARTLRNLLYGVTRGMQRDNTLKLMDYYAREGVCSQQHDANTARI